MDTENKDFFTKLWKCPFRRSWRYGRKFLFIATLGVLIWISLDFVAISLMKPRSYPPFISLLTHSILTIFLSLVLTLITQQIHIRLKSRFRLIRAYLPRRKSTYDK